MDVSVEAEHDAAASHHNIANTYLKMDQFEKALCT